MANTPHLTITLLEQAQAQKEVTVNEALFRIDAVLNSGANDKDLATPPVSPVAGDVYIIPASATGAWAGKTGQVAYFDQIWRFIVPNAGLMLWVIDEAKHYVYNAGVWNVLATGGGGGMNPATYDPANIAQQLVGTSATQTLTNKTLTSCDANTQTAGNNSTKVATTAYVDAAVSAGGGGGSASRVCEGRLTLTTGVPVTSADVVGTTNLYFTPFRGNNISLWNGTAWQTLSFSELTMALSGLTANLPYDVFAFINTGAVALERLAWTSNTVRATALTTQNGVYVKSGDATRRYLGTFYATSATTTEDSLRRRLLFNYHNKVDRQLQRVESTFSWTYSTAAWRQGNANALNQVEVVIGVVEDAMRLGYASGVTNSTTTLRGVSGGIGANSTTSAVILPGAQTGFMISSAGTPITAGSYSFYPTAGYNYYAWLEYGAGTDTQTWVGNNLLGITGAVRA
jgi:hypothetical protein